MSTLSSANVTDVNLVLKECTHMHLCLNMLIFTHNLGNWLIVDAFLSFSGSSISHNCNCFIAEGLYDSNQCIFLSRDQKVRLVYMC